MTLDPLLLSRLQFVWVIAWHILLPAFTVGLASYIAMMEGMYFFTRHLREARPLCRMPFAVELNSPLKALGDAIRLFLKCDGGLRR